MFAEASITIVVVCTNIDMFAWWTIKQTRGISIELKPIMRGLVLLWPIYSNNRIHYNIIQNITQIIILCLNSQAK